MNKQKLGKYVTKTDKAIIMMMSEAFQMKCSMLHLFISFNIFVHLRQNLIPP